MLVSDGSVQVMASARSEVAAHGQTAVPAEVRRKLGIGPGSVLEWHEEDERVVVRRAGRYTSEDVHRALFPNRPPAARAVEAMKAGMRRTLKKPDAHG
jgi:AbrB family looped-hinge helix DNA binding protein